MGSYLRKLSREIKRKGKPDKENGMCGKCGKRIDETVEAVGWDKDGDICEACFEALYMVQPDKAMV